MYAKGLSGSQLRRIPIPRLLGHLAEDADGEELARAFAAQADAWVADFAASVARDITPRPATTLVVAPSPQVQANGVVSVAHRTVWVASDNLECAFCGLEEAEAEGPGLMAVTPESWIVFPSPADIACLPSKDIGVETLASRALPEFHRLALASRT